MEGGALIETSGRPITPALNQCSSTPRRPFRRPGNKPWPTYLHDLRLIPRVAHPRLARGRRGNARSVVIFGFKSCRADRPRFLASSDSSAPPRISCSSGSLPELSSPPNALRLVSRTMSSVVGETPDRSRTHRLRFLNRLHWLPLIPFFSFFHRVSTAYLLLFKFYLCTLVHR